MRSELRRGHSCERHRISVCIGDHRPGRAVRRMARNVTDQREDRFVELDRVIFHIEICDRIRSKVGAEQICVRPISARERIAVAADQNIGTVATEECVASRRPIKDFFAISPGQGRIDAGLVVHPRIEHDNAQCGCAGSTVAIGSGVIERVSCATI